MKWVVHLEGGGGNEAIRWAGRFFGAYNLSSVEWLRIDRGRGNYEGVYGRCHYPTKERPTYRISCQVPGPFPCDIVTRRKPLYARADGSFPRAPRGCRRGTLCYDPRTGRRWYRLIGKTHVADLDEGIVWIVSHESFHFLRATRQVPGRNTEIDADRFADEQLEAFRQPSRRVTFVESLFNLRLFP